MMLTRFYDTVVFKYPRLLLGFVLLVVVALGFQSHKLEVDASAETLMLQDDRDLHFMREVNSRYYNPDYLVMIYTPKEDLLSDETIATLQRLTEELNAIESVASVTSILNVPLLQSPPKPVKELVKNVPTLMSPDANRTMAKAELLGSPIYSNNLVSKDFKTTAILVNFYDDLHYFELLNERNALSKKAREGNITVEEALELETVSAAFKTYRDQLREGNHQTIVEVREVMERNRVNGDLFLGGISMIADDMITYIKDDLSTYGISVLLLLIGVLWVVFSQLRFILLPVLISTLSVMATTGLLGMFGWEVTVISSNFIALQLIITMSLIIHLIVRYRELLRLNPDREQQSLVREATLSMAKPCFFVILTTIAGFSSLLVCDILPVINLGWMMSAGVAVSLLITFLVFPAVLVQMPKRLPPSFFETRIAIMPKLAVGVERYGKPIIVGAVAMAVFSISGASQLIVENSFIDYFKKSTEIYKGMAKIDRELGGTTPLDIVVTFDEEAESADETVESVVNDEFDAFEEEFEAMEGEAQYWFTAEKMAKVEKIHDYLQSIPEVGKVQSLATMLKVGKSLNDGEALDNFQLALLYNELPKEFRKIILEPYVNVEANEVRFTARIIDSNSELRRDALLKRINAELEEQVGLKPEEFRQTSMMVLYNNMLQSLFASQILTLGVVMLILSAMFLLLFRSLKVAALAMIANVIPVGVVFGFMGWAGIPLDMMTITIAAISLGIAVDDTIHYIHRFKIEVAKDGDYLSAMHRSHASIGNAMTYTSLAIMIGFSVLVLSNFIPTIYFGLLTVLAMFMAIAADLMLLPRLLMWAKPFKTVKEKQV